MNDPFPMDEEEIKKGNYNVYYCIDCRAAGKEHKIIEEPTGVTDKYSDWGPGVPTHTMKCTGCGKTWGDWVKASDVGEGY